MPALKVITRDGAEVKERWRPSRSTMLGGSMGVAGTLGLAALLILSPYRNVILGVLVVILIMAAWQVLMAKLNPVPDGAQHIVHHHRRSWFR